MLSATTTGRPSSISSCANTRCCSRLSIEHEDQHFGPSLAGEFSQDDVARHFLVGTGASSAYEPGRSTSSTGSPDGRIMRPALRSTVTPG